MSDDELPPPFDDSRWREYVKERLPVGGWCQSDYPVLVEVVGGLRCRLCLSPFVRLRRFSESSEVILGAKLMLKSWETDSEASCVLNHDELRAILDLYGASRECQHFSSVMPTQVQLGTRGGLSIRWGTLMGRPIITLELPRRRDTLLAPETYDELIVGMRACLDFVHEHFA